MARASELLPWSWASERLSVERNYWVATVTGRGLPHARPVWGVWHDDVLYLSVGAAGFRRVDERREVSVHVDSAVDVVIVDGIAERIGDGGVPSEAVSAYTAKYDMDGGQWINFAMTPRVAFGWRDGDVNTATRWTF